MVASVFLDDLTAHGLTDDDAGRVSEAFETVGRNTDRWPRPVEVIGAIPKREKSTPGLEHAISPEEAKAVRAAAEDERAPRRGSSARSKPGGAHPGF